MIWNREFFSFRCFFLFRIYVVSCKVLIFLVSYSFLYYYYQSTFYVTSDELLISAISFYLPFPVALLDIWFLWCSFSFCILYEIIRAFISILPFCFCNWHRFFFFISYGISRVLNFLVPFYIEFSMKLWQFHLSDIILFLFSKFLGLCARLG